MSKFVLLLLVLLSSFGFSDANGNDEVTGPRGYTLTVVVDGVRNSIGSIGLLMFSSGKGWPDELKCAYRGTTTQAEKSKTVLSITNVPVGEYGILVIHDENGNEKLDRDWKGLPKEQWGMSNNPRAYLAAPSFERAKFHVAGDREIHVTLK